ncbi:MAG TPA: hypothetical protein P5293_01025 [Bacteroidales bacterium]|nr:hypothetical protein [Bacteroidales bacterium]
MLNVDFRMWKDFKKLSNNDNWNHMSFERNSEITYPWLENIKIPLDDNIVDNLYASCVFSFMYPIHFPALISEIYRIMKPGGLIRTCVPDYEIGMKCYFDNPNILFKKRPPVPDFYPQTRLGRLMAWGSAHSSPEVYNEYVQRRISFDFETMEWYLKNAGFINIQKRNHNDCSPIFEGRDFEVNKHFVLYVEALKPDNPIDICIMAVRRPELLDTLLKSFKEKMNLNNNRIIINVDPVGENIPSERVIDIVYKYFNEVTYRLSDEANFTKAIKWCWSNVKTEYFLSLEDDWELLTEINLPSMMKIMKDNKNLAQLSLRWEKWKKRYERKAEYFAQPMFIGHPSLMRKSYIEYVLPLLVDNKNVEVQLKAINTLFEFGQYTGSEEFVGNLRDHGREWRESHGFIKTGPEKSDFILWKERAIEKSIDSNYDNSNNSSSE